MRFQAVSDNYDHLAHDFKLNQTKDQDMIEKPKNIPSHNLEINTHQKYSINYLKERAGLFRRLKEQANNMQYEDHRQHIFQGFLGQLYA